MRWAVRLGVAVVQGSVTALNAASVRTAVPHAHTTPTAAAATTTTPASPTATALEMVCSVGSVVVNATGLGAAALVASDTGIQAARGQCSQPIGQSAASG